MDLPQHPKRSHGLCVLSSLVTNFFPCLVAPILKQMLQAVKIVIAALRKLEVIAKTPGENEKTFNLKTAVLLGSFTDSFYLVSLAVFT